MLYVTSRNQHDAFTVAWAMKPGRAADGGFYQPYRLPQLDSAQIEALKDQSFSQTVADILNLFFPCQLTGWDVEFCVGRYPVRMESVASKIILAEAWHNLEDNFARMERNLTKKLCGYEPDDIPGWVGTAILIAVLFGIYGQLRRDGVIGPDNLLDVAVAAGDFSVPMSAWFARKMGLPIGNIICSCNENSGAWDLLHLEQMNTGAVARQTTSPAADYAVPAYLEQLIFNTLGIHESVRFVEACRRGGVYEPDDEGAGMLRQGMYAAVVGQERLSTIIANVARISGYILGPYDALAYGGLMDYRAKTGETGYGLILAERSPVCDAKLVSAALRISEAELRNRRM